MALIHFAVQIIFISAIFNAKPIRSIPIEKLHQYSTFNITKRPLNLYITANGKHASVNNRSIELSMQNKVGDSNTEMNADYRISEPPFAIKRRGSAILLHNVTGNSLSWHQGRPSLVQMIAASGHTTVAVELKNKISDNVKLIRQIVAAENLRNITFIVADGNGEEIVEQLLDLNNKAGVKIDRGQSVFQLVDGIVLLNDGENNVSRREKWRSALATSSSASGTVAILVVHPHKKESKADEVKKDEKDSAIKITNLDAPQSNVDDGQFRLMKILANFFDFIHPR